MEEIKKFYDHGMSAEQMAAIVEQALSAWFERNTVPKLTEI
jgi:hypothetical protein